MVDFRDMFHVYAGLAPAADGLLGFRRRIWIVLWFRRRLSFRRGFRFRFARFADHNFQISD